MQFIKFILLITSAMFIILTIYISTRKKCECPCDSTPAGTTPAGDDPTLHIIKYPDNLEQSHQSKITNYLKTIYPLTSRTFHNNYWKTLDFFWLLNCYNDENTNTYFRDPSNTSQPNNLFETIRKLFIKNIGDSKSWLVKSGNTYIQRNYFTPEKYDFYTYPLCYPDKIQGHSVNRYQLDYKDIIDNGVSAYCKTGTGVSEIRHTEIPSVSEFNLVKGFKDNSYIEITHCSTGSDEPGDISGQSFHLTSCKDTGYGVFYYYTRGSGIFINLKTTLVCINKIDLIRQLGNGGLGSIDKIQTYMDMIAFMDNKTGTDTTICNSLCSGSKPEFYSIKNKSTNQGCTMDYNNDMIWCTNDVALKRYNCCETSPNVCKYTANATDSACKFQGGQPIFWTALIPLIPETIYNTINKDRLKRQTQLAWILRGCVNGYEKQEFNQNLEGLASSPKTPLFPGEWNPQDYVNLYNQHLAHFANLGGKFDVISEDLINASKYDTIQYTVQPEVTGGFAMEIYAKANYFYTKSEQDACDTKPPPSSKISDNYASIDVLGTNVTKCKFVDNNTNKLLQCDKISWGQTYVFPKWNDGKSPYKLDSCQPIPPPSGDCKCFDCNRQECSSGECDICSTWGNSGCDDVDSGGCYTTADQECKCTYP